MDLALYAALFLLFSFLGWVLEVAYHAVKLGTFVNRGFLLGPICPIYGVGAVLLFLCLWQIRDRWVLLFVASVLLTTALELLTGFLLDKLFHTRWWDYSQNKFSFGGYVCLRFSLIWGLLCMLLVKGLFPLTVWVYERTPSYLLWPAEIVLLTLILADTVLTVIRLVGFDKNMERLYRLRAVMQAGSDRLGVGVYRTAVKAETEYQKLLEQVVTLERRFLDAFPTMHSQKYNEQITKLKERLASLRKKK